MRTKFMKMIALVSLFLVAMCPRVDAQECPDTTHYEEAREIVQDIGQIVNPSGIQESYKAKIGGIEQWLNIRGQDKANPIILFVDNCAQTVVTRESAVSSTLRDRVSTEATRSE